MPRTTTQPWPWFAISTTALAALAAGRWYWRRVRRTTPLPLEDLPDDDLLAALQQRLASAPLDDPRWQDLQRRLQALRFAPYGRPGDSPAALLADYRRLHRAPAGDDAR